MGMPYGAEKGIFMHITYIGAGSNMDSPHGGPLQNLEQAALELKKNFSLETKQIRASAVYWTEPQLLKEQAWFANQVFELTITERMCSGECLAILQKIERELGRTRNGARYGPRVIDLDLLLFGQEISSSESLTLPHPRLTERAFVLVPLAELVPDLKLPGLGHTVEKALASLEYRLDGTRIFQA